MLTADQFAASLAADRPPAGMDAPLVGLWWDAKGDWHKAHAAVDDLTDEAGMRVHAYLHRKEGDLANAAYWYGRTGRTAPDLSLTAEHEALVGELTAGAN